MAPEPAEQSALNKKALAYADDWLKWKTRPRLVNTPPPNPADYDLTPEQGQEVIDQCILAMERCAVERATKECQQPRP